MKTYETWYNGLKYEQQLIVDRVLGDAQTLGISPDKVKEFLQEEVKAELKEQRREEKREDERREERRDGTRGEKPSNELPGTPVKPSNELPSSGKPGTLPSTPPAGTKPANPVEPK